MYSPAIKHRLEARTEAQPSYELSPGTMSRNHPQAGSPGPTVAQVYLFVFKGALRSDLTHIFYLLIAIYKMKK